MVNHDRKFDNAAYLEKTGVFVFQFGGGKAKNLIKNLIENFLKFHRTNWQFENVQLTQN